MIVSDLAVQKRVSVVVLTLVIIGAGLMSYISLPREASPDITIPYVFVSTSYPGVSPADIENSITVKIEKKLKGLENVKRISSVSIEGYSSIVIEFVTGTDIDEVLQKVKDKVDEAGPDLPTDMDEEPKVTEINISEQPIIVLALSGNAGLVRLKEIAENLEDDIEAIPGILEVEVSGGLEREIRIEPAPEKLAYYGVSILSLQSVISSENQNVSGGGIRLGDGRFQLRVPGEFTNPNDIYNLVVATHEGRPVYLKDVAEVVDGFKDETSRSRLNGLPSVNMRIKKRSGENILDIVKQIEEIIDRAQLTWPRGTTVTRLMDQSEEIRDMVADLENNIITGLILVVAVLLFVMGPRNAVLVAVAIPFSMLLSFIILSVLGITLNMVVLFSLTLALGMLVDNAIVIVENIYRYMEQGTPRLKAAMKATHEVAYPVIGSTATTVCAFFPLIFWPGIMGEFMSYLPITVIVTLLSSLFVAMVINPALAAIFMKLPAGRARLARQANASAQGDNAEQPIEVRGFILRAYRAVLSSALKNRLAVMASSLVILVLLIMGWYLLVGLEKPIEFFPSIDPEAAYVNIDVPEGADLELSDRLARQVETAVCGSFGEGLPPGDVNPLDCYLTEQDKKTVTLHDGKTVTGPSTIKEIKHIYSKTVSVASGASVFESQSPNHIGIQFRDLIDRQTSSRTNLDVIRQRVKDIPGAKITIEEREEGPPTGAPINIEISGDNLSVLGGIAARITGTLKTIPFVEDVRDNYQAGLPTIKVVVDRQKAALFGLSTETIGFALKVAFNGMKVSTFRQNNEDYDITVQLPEEERKVIDLLRQLLLPMPGGKLIPLSTVTNYEITGSPGRVNRVNHQRVVTVKANVDENKIPGPVVRAQAEKMLAKFNLPPGYRIKFTGEFENQQEAQEFLSKAFVIALFLIVFVLVNQFNSVSQPLIIMTSVILSLGGVFLGLTLMKMPFGIIMSGVGVISLAGVVVNNAIVLIDYTNQLRNRGMEITEAIIAAGCTRLRPVLLTAVTTILGLIPMLTGISYDFHAMEISWISESTQWWGSMASAVIFGLALATVLTLVVVPVLYSLTESARRTTSAGVSGIKRLYWAPFYKITGTKPEDF